MTNSRGNAFAARLLDQQLWCFGQDIRRAEGNVLTGLGMCRARPVNGKTFSTLYMARLPGGRSLWLWAFGVLLRDPQLGAVWIKRYGFDPMLVANPPESPFHSPEELGARIRPVGAAQKERVRQLVQALAGWMARYEHWVGENLGAKYRQATLLGKPTPAEVPAREMAAAWERIAQKSWRFSRGDVQAGGPWGGLIHQLRLEIKTNLALSPSGRRGKSGVFGPAGGRSAKWAA